MYSNPLTILQHANDAAFMVRMEKLTQKLVKSKEKDTNSIIECLVNIKNEIETSKKIKINLDSYMNQVEKEMSKKGVEVSKKQYDAIKKKIKQKDKKTKNHARYIARVMYFEDYEMNAFDEEAMFISKRVKDEDKEDEEVVLPSILVYGVTLSLCGVFLIALPIPACKDWGAKLLLAGISACSGVLCTTNDENKKKDKEKR